MSLIRKYTPREVVGLNSITGLFFFDFIFYRLLKLLFFISITYHFGSRIPLFNSDEDSGEMPHSVAFLSMCLLLSNVSNNWYKR